MTALNRWIATAAVALGLGVAGFYPSAARADDDLVRVLVDVADVIYHGGDPYYRHGNYGRYDRVVIVRDRYGHRNYYRYVPRSYYGRHHRSGPPYGVAHGYYNRSAHSRRDCDHRGRCTISYYDPRRDYRHYDRRHDGRYDRRYDRRDYRVRDYRRYDDRRWHGRYDD